MASVGMAGYAFGETRWATPIRDLGLRIQGTALEPLVAEVEAELAAREIAIRPRFYLSTEWGVPQDTVAVAIPLYLASPQLTELQRQTAGMVEGQDPQDIPKYLRHEVGHVINYAHRLHERAEWKRLFGAMEAPYVEEYRPAPFSQRYVHHLPGWYAQKHPDEDWAETFAVWLTPDRDWASEYASWPDALAKLEYCDRAMRELRGRVPPPMSNELDLDVADIHDTIEQYYRPPAIELDVPGGMDLALTTVFTAPAGPGAASAADLLVRLEQRLPSSVFRWTGHFPERTVSLLRMFAERARELELGYIDETATVMEVTGLVTTLAMNYVLRGAYSS